MQVPDISAFLLVTGFPNLPLVIGLTIAPAQSLPLERLLGLPLLLFTLVEILLAYSAVTSFVRSQTAQFYRLVLEDSITGQGGVTGAQVGGSSGVPPSQIRSGLRMPAGGAAPAGDSAGSGDDDSPRSEHRGDSQDESGGVTVAGGGVPRSQLHRRRGGPRAEHARGPIEGTDSRVTRGGGHAGAEGGGSSPRVSMSDIVSQGRRGLAARFGGAGLRSRSDDAKDESEQGGQDGGSMRGRRQRLQPVARHAEEDDGY